MDSRYITEYAEAEIVAEIHDWARGFYGKKLTWEFLENKYSYSRQAMSRNRAIKDAYEEAKVALRGGVNPKTEVENLREQLNRAKKRIEELEKVEDAYKAKWIIWRHNAAMQGMTEDDLNRPLERGFKTSQRLKKN